MWLVQAETEAGAVEGRRYAAPGESAPVKLPAAWAAPAGEGTKRRRNRVRAFVEYPKTGNAHNAGHAPYRAAESLSSIEGKAAPLHPRSATELANLNKRPPPPASVRVEIRHWRDGKQKPNKQRELLQKGPVQQIKFPVGNTDYRKGPIDMEKCKLERGAIWNWTEPTLTATAPEKFLDIFLLFFFN